MPNFGIELFTGMKKAPRLPSGCKFSKNSSCDFGLPSSVTSDTYYQDTHNDYCKKPSPRHIVIFFYSVVKTEVSLCVPNNCICREFFLYKLSTGHSNQYKRICGLDVRPPHKNIIILVAGEVKKSVRSGSTVVGCDSSGRERCTVLQGHNEDIRDVRKVISGIKPPYFRGETLLKPDGSRRSYITKYRESIRSSKNSVLSRIMSKKEGNNMADQQYITVKEFAQRAGVSIQSVYQSLNKRLKPYFKVINGRKMLDIKALGDIYGIPHIEKDEQGIKQDYKDNDKLLINLLMEQIKVKDKEIADLHELLNHEQQLFMIAQNKITLLEQKQAENEESQAKPEDHRQADPESAGDQNTVEQVKPVQSQAPEKQSEEKEQEYNLFEPEQTSIWERIKNFFKGV